MVLDQGPTPLYHQLKNILKSRILSNELKGNQRLPTEAELCVEYNVSRITVRQALSELMKDGLIYRDRGRGTFVTERAELKRPELKGSIENLIAAAKGTRTRVLSYKEVLSPPSYRQNFPAEEDRESVSTAIGSFYVERALRLFLYLFSLRAWGRPSLRMS